MLLIKFFISLLLVLSVVNISYAEKLVDGFIDYSIGSRVVADENQSDDFVLNEVRLRVEFSGESDIAEYVAKIEALNDSAGNGTTEASVFLREGYVVLLPSDMVELKIGRQISTWGTGDFIFINDLFPKNWQSFFSGRNDEYLKGPSDSLKVSFYPEFAGIDVILTPTFTPDEYLTGERFSFFDPSTGGLTGDDALFVVFEPAKRVKNAEAALRVTSGVSGVELALYGYRGFFKRPLGFNPNDGSLFFPELSVYGASARGTLFGGIANIEFGYYDSVEDRNGKNPFIDNSDIKTIIGFERELSADFNIGLQHHAEYMASYGNYRQSFAGAGETAKNRLRQLITVRLEKLLLMQTLRLSLFSFYSPTDNDFYLRPSINYKWTDELSLVLGGNIFEGEKVHTFFGQLKDNTNIYARVRYGF